MPAERPFRRGEIVYRRYSPQQVGKVIEDLGFGRPERKVRYFQNVRVRWCRKGNPVTEEKAASLRSLEDLIIETETKLLAHQARMEKASLLPL
jgi:hypothetical protein